MDCNNFSFSGHAIKQMFERNISKDEIKETIETGEIIKSYPDDKPYPSYLILALINSRPIHVVMAKNQDNSCIVITAYEPKIEIWNPDFKTKI